MPDSTPLSAFAAPVRAWFSSQFESPTPVQIEGWQRIAAGDHVLLSAPTGSGKTLAAFLWGLSELSAAEPVDEMQRLRLLYISPLRALNYDIERNLRAPLAGIAHQAQLLGKPIPDIRVGVRTGDTPQRERAQQRRHPPDIFITTPESLYVLLSSSARELLTGVRWVIVDEIHAVAGSKRGTHLALSLERLSALVGSASSASGGPPADVQRIGLSATQRPIELVARFLGGAGREVHCVQAPQDRRYDLQVCVPVDDMTAVGSPLPQTLDELDIPSSNAEGYSIWTALYRELYDHVRSHRSTIVFTNSRRLSERLALQLNELATADANAQLGPDDEPVELVIARAHHGSIARETRREIEEMLKAGTLPAIIATSSLELGIDMGAVDQVLHVESPKTVAAGIQRIGRAGHHVGSISRGRIYPKFRGDLVECAAVARAILQGDIEPVRIPTLALDVLSQQLVAMAAVQELSVDEAYAIVTRAMPYRDLSREQLENVLRMLAGEFPSDELADMRPRIVWNRETDTFRTREAAARIALTNAGTIPDRGLYGVFLLEGSTRVGELDEEMVHETRAGDVIVLGATSWRVEEISRDRVLVSPVPGVVGKTPFWHGEGAGRSLQLGQAVGELLQRVAGLDDETANDTVASEYALDRRAAANLVQYVREQSEATGEPPTANSIIVERFRDELGDWRLCLLSPFGKGVHAPWAMAVEARLLQQYDIEANAMWSDDGIALRLPDTELALSAAEIFLIETDDVEDLVVGQLAGTALFASRFREIATRSLLLPLPRFQRRSPLWLQRLRAADMQRAVERFGSFPMILETYRECLRDVFDLPALRSLLSRIAAHDVRVSEVETRSASPFAAALLFDYTAQFLYDGDRPSAERRAQALSLDQSLLRELLGSDELRDLLDADAIASVGEELQRTAEGRAAQTLDAAHDLVRELGDLSPAEIAERWSGRETVDQITAALVAERRAVCVRICGEPRYIAIDDVGRYRDGLGVQEPQGVPAAYLEPSDPDEALQRLIRRYERTHTPFRAAAIADRWGVPVERISRLLVGLRERGDLLNGGFLPAGTEPEWCDPEVLRRLRRRTLSVLRRQIEPVEQHTLSRFLLDWHGLANPRRRGVSGLRDAVLQLEGIEATPTVWERDLLGPRLQGGAASALDEMFASGELVWVGRGTGRGGAPNVSLYLREHVPLVAPVPDEVADEPAVQTVHAALDRLGASFLADIVGATGLAHDETLEALWALALSGHASNDSWQTVRERDAAATGRAGGGRRRSRAATAGRRHAALAASMRRRRASRSTFGSTAPRFGRWSLVRMQPAADDERLQATAELLLDCYGVLMRPVAQSRRTPGGFAALYRELTRQEELGQLRRGYFVEGLGGAQFALPEVVDRLRTWREPARAPVVSVLHRDDPAQPYGSLLPWPQRDADDRPFRAPPTGYVVLADGEPVALVQPTSGSMTLLAGERLELAAQALADSVEQGRFDRVTVDRVNGRLLERTELSAFAGCGFVRTPRGVRITAVTRAAAANDTSASGPGAVPRRSSSGRHPEPPHPHGRARRA